MPLPGADPEAYTGGLFAEKICFNHHHVVSATALSHHTDRSFISAKPSLLIIVVPDLPTVPLLAGQSRFFTRCPVSR